MASNICLNQAPVWAEQAKDDPPNQGSNSQAMVRAATRGDLAQVQRLLDGGFSPDSHAGDRQGRSALILASAGGHSEVVQALLESGAAVNGVDSSGLSALNWAALRGRYRVAGILLENGADIDTSDNAGVSPLLYAVGNGNLDLQRLFLTHGANTEIESQDNKMTALLLAVERGDTKSVTILLGADARINRGNLDGLTPLMAASEKGDAAMVLLLLKRGADTTMVDRKGRTALSIARKNRHQQVVELIAGYSQ